MKPRFVTDHVAMVVLMASEPDEVFLLEATANFGVQLSRFSEKKQFVGNYFRKMVLRTLDWKDRDEHINKLVQFCEETNGAQYSLKNKFSLASRSAIGGASAQDGGRMVDEDRAFFCSELIAKAYKECMIMQPSDKASASFNPGHFSS